MKKYFLFAISLYAIVATLILPKIVDVCFVKQQSIYEQSVCRGICMPFYIAILLFVLFPILHYIHFYLGSDLTINHKNKYALNPLRFSIRRRKVALFFSECHYFFGFAILGIYLIPIMGIKVLCYLFMAVPMALFFGPFFALSLGLSAVWSVLKLLLYMLKGMPNFRENISNIKKRLLESKKDVFYGFVSIVVLATIILLLYWGSQHMYLISEFYNSHRYLIAEMIAFVLTFPLVSCLSMAVCHSGIKKRKNTLVNQYKIESYFDNIDIYFISEKTLASIENLYAELRIEVEKNIKKYPKESSFILSKNHTTEKQLFPNLYRNVEVAQSIVNIPDEISNNKMKSKVISTNVAKPKSEPNVPLSKPSDVVPKKVQEANWQEVNARFFNEKEQLSTDYAQVVSSQDGKSVCFHLVGGKVLRFPLESNSSVKVDDYP